MQEWVHRSYQKKICVLLLLIDSGLYNNMWGRCICLVGGELKASLTNLIYISVVQVRAGPGPNYYGEVDVEASNAVAFDALPTPTRRKKS